MKSLSRTFSVSWSRSNGSWLTVLLLVVVIVPSVCLLWFMNRAVGNEELAMRQRLAEAYRGNLAFVQRLLETHWQQTAEGLETAAAEEPAPALFARLVREDLADAVLVFDTNDALVYPDRITATQVEPLDSIWAAARSLEADDLAAAARAYARISEQTTNLNLAALALQSQARCLVQAGERDAAITVLTGRLTEPRYQDTTDGDGRQIAANAALMAFELLSGSNPDRAATVLGSLKQQLNDYANPMPSAQRRFLMRELERLCGEDNLFPTLAAEDLAARYLEAGGWGLRDPVVRVTTLPDTWQFASSHGRVLTLHHGESLVEQMRRSLPEVGEPNVRVDFIPPGQEAKESLLSLAAGTTFQGWRLSLSLKNQQLYEEGAKRKARVYVWVGVLVVLLVLALAVLALGLIRRQAALTQLRNDLVANVTHELKTPLASTRLLVETLLHADKLDEQPTREYLQLIATENLRLSRLIDNFLTFSRIERNKYTFDFKEVPAETIAGAAATAVRERFHTSGCRFEVRIPSDLPKVRADADAMVTALLNLLDNAYKYSGESKQIELSVGAENGSIAFSVNDNGIGLSARDAKQVFKRFYQVNQHLSRSSGGAGLGLSIVQFIVTAHQGTVRVESEPQRGSRFTVTIPAAGGQQSQEPKA